MNAITCWLQERYPIVSPRDFYREIFPSGELDIKDAFTEHRYTGIIAAVTNKKKADGGTLTRRYTLTDDLDAIDIATASDDFCICAPISYAGKRRSGLNARFLYAFAFDVDNLKMKNGEVVGLSELIGQTQRKMWGNSTHNILPTPTFIVSSGSGAHLYYVLDKPIPLYREYAQELQDFKRDLERRILNPKVTSDSKIVHQGIYQGMRMPGTVTKDGGRAVAFRTGERVTMDYLNEFVAPANKAVKCVELKPVHSRQRLEEAAKKYSEWYERRIVRGEKRGVWHVNRAVYEWWRSRVMNEAEEGHRYFCVMMLAVYAQKCSYYDEKHNPNPVTLEELERDAYGMLDLLDGKTHNEKNHFTSADIQNALEAFQDQFVTYPRKYIEQRTGLEIPRNERNDRKQGVHLQIARATLDIMNKERGKPLQGRKSAAAVVAEWREHNPGRTKADCVRDTGLTKPTVYKHWSGIQPPTEATGGADREAAAALAQIERRIKAEIEKQRAALMAYEKNVEELRAALDAIPDGVDKERYKKRLEIAEEDLAALKRDFPGKV